MKFLGVLSVLAAFVAGCVFLVGMIGAQSAPQEAAIAGMALAIAVIPYVLFQAVQTMKQADEMAAMRRALEDLASRNPTSAPSSESPWVAEVQPPRPNAHVVKSHPMGLEGWWWREMSDGSVRISDPQGANYGYPDLGAARLAFTWWDGPSSGAVVKTAEA